VKKILFLILSAFASAMMSSKAQLSSLGKTYNPDSLLQLIKTDKEDTLKAFHLYNIARALSSNNPDSSKLLGLQAKYLSEKLHWDRGIGYSSIVLAWNKFVQSDYPGAFTLLFEVLHLAEKTKDRRLLSITCGVMASCYEKEKEYEKSLQCCFKSLKIDQEIGNNWSAARNYGLIGIIYFDKKKYKKALEYYFKALNMAQEIGNNNGYAVWLSNIGTVYKEQKQYKTAMEYNLQALKVFSNLNNNWAMAETYAELGDISLLENHYSKSFDYLHLGLKLALSVKSKDIEALCYQKLCKLYEKSTIPLTDSLGGLLLNMEQMRLKSLYYSRREITLTKQIFNDEKNKQILSMEFDIKVAASLAEQKKKDEFTRAESKKQKSIILLIGLGLLSTILFSAFVYKSLRTQNKQNKIITGQKQILEFQNQEIKDSIQYALRIQSAILPPKKIVYENLKNSFVLYKPKDIVSGDFYWMEMVDDLLFIAACDCTGHGVPGAMVSVLCHSALTRAVKEFGLTQPSKILDKASEIIVESFSKSEEELPDGMDISLCSIHSKTRTLEWAGANNSLLLINNSELIEIKADKQCIGYNENVKPFTNHQFSIEAETSIYLYTDGFADQFGGNPERKLTKRKFKELLLSVNQLSPKQQENELNNFLIDFQQTSEQTDDILVIGVKV